MGKTVRYFLNYSESPQKIEYFYKNGRELLTGKAMKPGDSIEIPAEDHRRRVECKAWKILILLLKRSKKGIPKCILVGYNGQKVFTGIPFGRQQFIHAKLALIPLE